MQTEHEKALDIAKINLVCRPDSIFLCTILFSLNIRWDSAIPTACTNGKNLRINPEFFLSLDKDVRIFVLAHEAYHVAFEHMCRVGDRDFRDFNRAADYVINLMLKDAGFKLWEHCLVDEKYRDMSTDDVYKLIAGDDEDEDFETDFEQNDDEEVQQQIQETIIQASIKARQGGQAGTIPGDVERFIEEMLNPELPWQRILERQYVKMARKNYSYAKPNRRYLPDFYLPTLYAPDFGEVAIAIDVSGSVSQEEFDSFMPEVLSIHDTYKPDKTTVVSFDTEITSEQYIRNRKEIQNIQFTGGGGTRISPVYEWINKHQPKAVVIFTDGYFDLCPDDIPKGMPIYWIIYDNLNFKTPVGKVIPFKVTPTNAN